MIFKIIICLFFLFSTKTFAANYINNDLSAPIASGTAYDNVTITNNRNLSSSDGSTDYLYFYGSYQNSFTVNNNSNLGTTGSNASVIYLPFFGNTVEGQLTATINNSGTISTTGNWALPIYIPSGMTSDDNGTPFDPFDDIHIPTPFDFVLNNSGTISSENHTYASVYLISNDDPSTYEINNSGAINSGKDAIYIVGKNVVINNSGTIAAASSSDNAAYITGDNFTFNVLDGSSITGKIAAGGSNNILNVEKNITIGDYDSLLGQFTGTWKKNILSTLSVGSATDFSIASGETVSAISLSANDSTVSNSGTLSALNNSGTGNTLVLATGSATGNIVNSGSLALSPGSSNISYSGEISGAGSLIKSGSGRLELTGTNTYNGATTVAAGELKVNGNIASSAVTVNSGAMISGTGTVGDLTINSGGTLAAGNSVGTMHVSGDLNLNSGSTTDFEFNSSGIDKIIASGDVHVGGTAAFKLYGADGYFTVTQNILETTGGTVSGSFDNVTTDNGFATSLTYGASSVRATVSKTLNSNVLDATLSSQNALGRILSKALTDKMHNTRFDDKKKYTTWFSTDGFSGYRGAVENSAPYSTSGNVSSAGLIGNQGSFQIIGGFFNSRATIKRYVYSGQDTVDTNGAVLGVGKNTKTSIGDFYTFIQTALGVYNFDNKRNVNVNGAFQSANGNGLGNFRYVNFGGSYAIPSKNYGEFSVFSSLTLQKTQHGAWQESGLSSGNFRISRSSADTSNFEIGAAYKNNLPRISKKLPKGAFYKLELTGYKSHLYSKRDAIVTGGDANGYALAPQYMESIIFGASGYFSVPLSKNIAANLRLDRRQNGMFRESVGSLGVQYGF